MRLAGAMVTWALVATAASGEETLREISWSRLKQEGGLAVGELRPAESGSPFESLLVTNGPEPRTATLVTVDNPGITKPRYALTGQIRYDGVEGQGYLEMWSIIPGKGSFFSRTLATFGPMASLEGSSGWRTVLLRFDGQGAPPPSALTVNLVLPGRGTVQLGPLRLLEYGPGDDPAAASRAWWGPETAGLVGGIAGSVIGCLGALIGFLTQKAKGRGFALGLLKALLAMGAVSLGFGLIALLRSQPYAVVYPLLLGGVLCLGLPLFLLPTVRRRYEDLELRKMRAQDLGTHAR